MKDLIQSHIVRFALSALAAGVLIPVASFANDGANTGGGGIGIICRDRHDRVSSVELLDFAEAEGKVPESTESQDIQFKRALERLRNAGPGARVAARDLEEKDDFIQTRIVFPSEGLGLSYVDDARDRLKGTKRCSHEQIAVYQMETQELKVDRKLYELLSPTAVAAFRVHEAVYALAKERRGAKDSLLVRRFVRTIMDPKSSAEEILNALPYQASTTDILAEQMKNVYALATRPMGCDGNCQVQDFEGTFELIKGDASSCTTYFRIKPQNHYGPEAGFSLETLNWESTGNEADLPEANVINGRGYPEKPTSSKMSTLSHKTVRIVHHESTIGMRLNGRELTGFETGGWWRTRLGRAFGFRPMEPDNSSVSFRIDDAGNLVRSDSYSQSKCEYRRLQLPPGRN